ncbi:MAG: hypothetical protein ABI361_09240 [Nitrososphaera sp.]|jgi:hypothetical protein
MLIGIIWVLLAHGFFDPPSLWQIVVFAAPMIPVAWKKRKQIKGLCRFLCSRTYA